MYNLLYFLPYGTNFGDELNLIIIRKITENNSQVQVNFVNMNSNKQCLIYPDTKIFSFIGSIMHMLPPNIDIIGTGVNDKYNVSFKKFKNILALRGPLTHNYLIKKGFNIPDNVIYGDPALLIPRLFPEWLDNKNSKGIGLIPHFNDIEYVKKCEIEYEEIEIMYPNNPASVVIDFIRSKEFIISSSLHGIIVSEMLNKKVKWILLEGSMKSEGTFKYLDYFESTGRKNIQIGEVLPPPVYNSDKLFNLVKNYLF